MSLRIIANAAKRQTRVAILEGDRLAELLVERGKRVTGNIYKCRVENVVRGLDAAFVECGLEKNVFLHVSDAVTEEPSRQKMRKKMTSFPPIGKVVHEGEEFLMQIVKGPLGDKGARGTRRISLPGRYLVLMTDTEEKVGVSKKIEDEGERKRLRTIGHEVCPDDFGIIVRTRAQGATREDLEADVRFLTKLWQTIQGRTQQSSAPSLIHEDLSLVLEVLRDVFSEAVDEFIIDDKVTYDKVLNLLNNVAPELRSRVRLYREEEPIFTHFGIEQQIEQAIQPKVWLPHGGWLNIEQTEALTTIDVNTGKFTGRNLEDTVLRTNLEAAEEVARQLKLRDIGGIIVIDFIDMDKRQHRKQVTVALRRAFEQDRMKTRIMHITRLGLVEMTRKRTGESLSQILQTTCPCCSGHGRVLSAETVAAGIEREIRRQVREDSARLLHVIATPQVIVEFIGPFGEYVDELEEELDCEVYARADASLNHEHYEIIPAATRRELRRVRRRGVDHKLEVQPEDLLRIPEMGLVGCVDGLIVYAPEVSPDVEEPVKVRLTKVANSYARATPVGK
ncbi:MAG: Rne/Rng family ribonuclease [candidate division WS1 bacterium]|jgi:ribonuclease G|nr:Rne/Rng family ribonuclease [candidate division WS1 bacterium]